MPYCQFNGGESFHCFTTMTATARPFTVVADGGACVTYCSSLKGAIRSAKNFSPLFTSLVIRHNFELVKVIR
jgi:hypothetical protein